MKICIPVVRPEGLSSPIEADPAEAMYLHFFDLENDTFDEIDLRANGSQVSGFDAVICAKLNRQVFHALRQRGVEVFLTEAVTVSEALDEFRSGAMFRIPDDAAGHGGGCGGGCHGHEAHEGSGCGGGCHSGAADHDHDHSGGGCGGGCGGHGNHGEAHGQCCSGSSTTPVVSQAPRLGALKIAVTSQNRKTVTEHAGKCRKFWIYEVQDGEVSGRTMLELSLEESFHEWNSEGTHPISVVDVLISASMGDGMKQRLAGWGIEAIVTSETDPDVAVANFLSGSVA